jgi:hypothetical protein
MVNETNDVVLTALVHVIGDKAQPVYRRKMRWRSATDARLTRPRSQRSRSDEDVCAKVRASFLASDRTYGARRVWHDLLADGVRCGLHRIERLMRQQALKARPRRARPQL